MKMSLIDCKAIGAKDVDLRFDVKGDWDGEALKPFFQTLHGIGMSRFSKPHRDSAGRLVQYSVQLHLHKLSPEEAEVKLRSAFPT